jgi:hypothetical protein
MSHEIDARVDRNQASGLDPALDHATRESRGKQVPPRDDPVLSPRDLG